MAEDGQPDAPAVLLIHGTGACAAWWDPVVPQLAGACRVIRVDLATGPSARERSLPERLGGLGLPVLVVFGAEDKEGNRVGPC